MCDGSREVMEIVIEMEVMFIRCSHCLEVFCF